MKKIPFIIIFLGLVLPIRSWAQPSIRVQVDRDTVTMNETFRLNVVIKGGSALTTPNIPPKGNFEVLGKSTGNSIEIINGKMTVTNSFEYLLKPTKAGKFTIGPITTHIEGKIYSAGPVKVTVLPSDRKPTYAPVVPPGPPPQVPTTPGYPGPQASPQPKTSRPDTFVTAQLDKKEAYIGEQILYTFRLYSAVNLQNAQLKLPEFKEFISEELIKERKYEVDLDGRRYAVNEWRLALFPTKAGTISTGQASVQANVAVSYRSRNPFDDPFFRRMPFGRQYQDKTFSTKNLKITVKELPPSPKDFSGLVGDFTIDSHLDQERLQTGETINFKVVLRGKGNIREGKFPRVSDSPYFKVYPGTPEVEEDKTLKGLGGKKIFSYALVAQRPGKTKLGPYTTSYFNPKAGTYEELKIPGTPVQIFGGGSKESLVSAGIDQRPDSILSPGTTPLHLTEIQGIPAVLTRQVPTSINAAFWWALLLLPPGAFLLLELWQRGRRRRFAQADDRKRSQAFRRAKQSLSQVDWEAGGDSFSQVTSILKTYLSDAFLIKGGALTPSEVEELLVEKRISADTIRRMVYLLEELDSWKYGGMTHNLPGGQQLREEIVDLLRKIEKAL